MAIAYNLYGCFAIVARIEQAFVYCVAMKNMRYVKWWKIDKMKKKSDFILLFWIGLDVIQLRKDYQPRINEDPLEDYGRYKIQLPTPLRPTTDIVDRIRVIGAHSHMKKSHMTKKTTMNHKSGN